MWGAIIQAIDHAMGRMQEGAGAGIKVANSQHGGGAPISKMDSGAGEVAKQDLRNQQDTTSEQEEAAEQSKIGSNSTSTGSVGASGGIGASTGSVGAGASGGLGAITGAESAGASGGIGAIAGSESTDTSGGIGATTGAESADTSGGIAEAASGILSDENAKTSKPVSKLQSVRAYGANAGKGFANAGAIATGSKAAEWENIDNSFAKKAAEDTVKGWRKRDFNKQENASTTEGK